MSQGHSIVATVAAVAGAIITAEAPALRALAGLHPTATGVIVTVLLAVLGALPSSVGAKP